ncbi:MAG: glycosyltransferase family 4 protein [Flavobacteriales bacterium]|nr:glycosyltransferase family 4 protein [Flavobacteriales bacterium]
MPNPTSICFLADRHDLFDDRIYWKMAVPLVKKGFQVHYILIGEDHESGTTSEGIHFKILKLKTFSKHRLLNFILKRLNPLNNYRLMLEEAKAVKADIYHFHDLWINRIGAKFKNLPHNPVVFYDAREPYAEDYRSYVKSSFPFFLNLFASWVDYWEKNRANKYDLVIANEINVQQNFAKVIGDKRTAILYNYMDSLHEMEQLLYEKKTYDLIYCGAVTELRGAFEILKAVNSIKETLPEIKVLILGKYYPLSLKEDLYDYINKNNLQDHIELKNAVPYNEVAKYYQLSKIGLVLLKKVKTFEVSMPIKIFEYMAFGLPIIGSDFGHIKDYIEKDSCGITVSPDDTESIGAAVLSLLKDHDLYQKLSENGLKASLTKYRWELEFDKLLEYYKKALNDR